MFYLLQIINHSSGLQVFLVVLVVWLSLELWGFVAYKKKARYEDANQKTSLKEMI